ncbi:MAG TPA: EamA family transporter [Stellaceae bacterium]|nr:EamA family transporter [Stellaceae bacterium]
MTPGFWGALSALSLGGTDFLARFSSRGTGHANAFFGVLVVGTLGLTIVVALGPWHFGWNLSGLWLAALSGAATTVMSLLFYQALARGPVTVVAPIVASHPAFVILYYMLLGARPDALHWVGIVLALAGGLLVAQQAESAAPTRDGQAGGIHKTLMLAGAAAVAYAVLAVAGQAAAARSGAMEALWLGRLASLATIVLLFAVRGERPRIRAAWLPIIAAQGFLDTGGYLLLLLGVAGAAAGSTTAPVTSSTFGAVTTLLAFVFLRERIGPGQWLGIVLVFAGVATLSS